MRAAHCRNLPEPKAVQLGSGHYFRDVVYMDFQSCSLRFRKVIWMFCIFLDLLLSQFEVINTAVEYLAHKMGDAKVRTWHIPHLFVSTHLLEAIYLHSIGQNSSVPESLLETPDPLTQKELVAALSLKPHACFRESPGTPFGSPGAGAEAKTSRCEN